MPGEKYSREGGSFDGPTDHNNDHPPEDRRSDSQPDEFEPPVDQPEYQLPEPGSDIVRIDVEQIVPAALGEADDDHLHPVETTAEDPADRMVGDFIAAQHLAASIGIGTEGGASSMEERLNALPEEARAALKAFVEYSNTPDLRAFASLTQEEAERRGQRLARQAKLDIYPVHAGTAPYVWPTTTPELLDLPLTEHWKE